MVGESGARVTCFQKKYYNGLGCFLLEPVFKPVNSAGSLKFIGIPKTFNISYMLFIFDINIQ
jgi:hypothetical protein